MHTLLWTMVALEVIGTMVNIAYTGKPKPASTPATVVFSSVVNVGFAFVCAMYAMGVWK